MAQLRNLHTAGPGYLGHSAKQRPRIPETTKKTGELKPSCPRVKEEDKVSIPKTKRKKYPTELSQDRCEKPQTLLGMHMLENVQVFHSMGKKSERKWASPALSLVTFCSNQDLMSVRLSHHITAGCTV